MTLTLTPVTPTTVSARYGVSKYGVAKYGGRGLVLVAVPVAI